MSLKVKFENTIEAIREVSHNAICKHGKSRSRQRIFQLSVELQKTWNLYKTLNTITTDKRIIYHVIKHATNGLKVNTITRRTGLDKRTTTKLLAEMYVQDKVIIPVNISDKKGCYVDTKYKIKNKLYIDGLNNN